MLNWTFSLDLIFPKIFDFLSVLFYLINVNDKESKNSDENARIGFAAYDRKKWS